MQLSQQIRRTRNLGTCNDEQMNQLPVHQCYNCENTLPTTVTENNRKGIYATPERIPSVYLRTVLNVVAFLKAEMT